MIKKFLKIRNIGRFEKYDVTGDIEFRHINLIYADNGGGKTTLTSILRSLKEQNKAYITERHTVDKSDAPEVHVLANDRDLIKFYNGIWDRQLPELEIFDSHFINNNVYTGYYVDINHTRELYRFVIGDAQAALAKKIDNLDTQSRKSAQEINLLEKNIQYHCENLPIQQFLSLTPVANIDQEISKIQQEIETLKKADPIKNRAILKTISLSTFPIDRLELLLQHTIANIGNNVEHKIKEHITTFLDNQGDIWLHQGYKYVHDEKQICPFCGQSLEKIDLFNAFKAYFSEEYANLLQRIGTAEKLLNQEFAEHKLRLLENTISENDRLLDFWQIYIPLNRPTLSREQVIEAWQALSQQLLSHLQRKKQNPLDIITISNEWQKAYSQYRDAMLTVQTYNEQIEQINSLIIQKKTKTATGDLAQNQIHLAKLEMITKRFKPEIQETCKKYSQLLTQKKQIENEKTKIKKQLDQTETDLLSKYEKKINHYLYNFGAGFEFTEHKKHYKGGKPSSTYRIKIKDQTINLGDSETIGTPSFKSVLSDGDKSTLALALFLAKLDNDSNLADKIVVIDDPVSSFDAQRRHCTVNTLGILSTRVKQLFILSHDQTFLQELYENGNVNNNQTRLLCIRKIGSDSNIEAWNMEETIHSFYYQRYSLVKQFIETGQGELLGIVNALRPLLEGYLRVRFPGIFAHNHWLGNFLDQLRDANSGDALYVIQSYYSEISEINDYSKSFHHDEGMEGRPINPTELRCYAERTLKVING